VALPRVADAQRMTGITGAGSYHSETLRLRGGVLAGMGDPVGGEDGYREAIVIAQR
jgi:hypothetical protein